MPDQCAVSAQKILWDSRTTVRSYATLPSSHGSTNGRCIAATRWLLYHSRPNVAQVCEDGHNPHWWDLVWRTNIYGTRHKHRLKKALGVSMITFQDATSIAFYTKDSLAGKFGGLQHANLVSGLLAIWKGPPYVTHPSPG